MICAGIIFLALLPIELWNMPGQITRRIHDEIIIEAPDEKMDSAAQILKDSMIELGKMYLTEIGAKL